MQEMCEVAGVRVRTKPLKKKKQSRGWGTGVLHWDIT